MSGQNQTQISGDKLDRLLDAVLAKYGAAEPRPGLEDRILASLRAESESAPVRAWWKWALAGAAAVVIIAVALSLRSERKSLPVMVRQPTVRQGPTSVQSAEASVEQRTKRETATTAKGPAGRPIRQAASEVGPMAASGPKLDQFPSPRPLTEEEKMLLGFIEHNPERAALLAEARMESLRRDAEERHRLESEDRQTAQ